MYYDQEITTLRAACTRTAIKVPDPIASAEATRDAAQQMVDGIAAETEPTLSGLTAKNLNDRVAEVVAWESHDARLEAASRIATAASAQVRDAWFHAGHYLMGALRAPFDEAAGAFVEQLTALGGDLDTARVVADDNRDAYNALMAAAATLKLLANARGILGRYSKADVGDSRLAALGTLVHVPDRVSLRGAIPNALGRAADYEPEWWAALAQVPGVVIRWHTPTEQQRYLDLPNTSKAA